MPGTIGFVGLGSMGAPMAESLLKAGFGVRVFNRTAEKMEPLVAAGASAAGSPAEAAEAGVVVTMVSNDAALREVTAGEGGVLERLGEEGLHISMSTVSAETSRELAAEHARRGALFAAAPVFGRPEAAAAGKLWICASGAAEARRRARSIFGAMGQGVYDFGDDPGAANVAKLAGNFLIAAAIEAMAEAAHLAERSGLDREGVLSMLDDTLFACPVYQNYGRMISQRRFEPAGFRLRLGLKDVGLVLGNAEAVGAEMPMARLLHERFERAVDAGRGDMDWTAVALELEPPDR